MTLTEKERGTLRKWGYLEEDLNKIEGAAWVVTYKRNGMTITADNAKFALGQDVWLSGLARSVFHQSAAREDRYGVIVYFDASELYRA